MKPCAIKDGIWWVGAVDWNRRNFHGYSLSHKGTTYNNYLIKDEKIALVDTVAKEFWSTLKCNIAHVLKPGEKIDYFVINHLEPDHAGCLALAVEKYQPEKIYVSPMGQKAMETHFHYKGWPVEVVPTGTEISLGKRTLKFIEARMLHWPDSMLTYCPEDKIVFTNDAFGQNWATSERFVDQVDRPTLERLMAEYYANIVLPYSPVVLKLLDTLAEMKLDVDTVCPDHGLIFRGDDCAWAMEKYRAYAVQKPLNKAVIVYDTMWHSTEKMALAVASGLADAGVSVRVMCMKNNHHSEVMSEIFDAAAVIVGSPTHNNGILPLMADMLTYIKGLRPQNKIGAAIGSFGWSGECVKILNQWLEDCGMEVMEAVKVKHVPDHEILGKCYEQGKAIAAAIQGKLG
ncbi:MAG: flavodoxin domain-containing protein [Pseudodesulfovibrio sp.]